MVKSIKQETAESRATDVRAYETYKTWFLSSGFGKTVRSLDSFKRSTYYRPFVSLDAFCLAVDLGDQIGYARWLAGRRVPSDEWEKDSTLAAYRKDVERGDDVADIVSKTLTNVELWCRERGIVMRDFFQEIPSGELIRWVETCRMSPWVLILAETARHALDRMGPSQAARLSAIVDVCYWEARLGIRPEITSTVEEILREAGL